jgi:hypothetical protein
MASPEFRLYLAAALLSCAPLAWSQELPEAKGKDRCSKVR